MASGSMIQYLRIPKNKFWAWVFSSLAIGLLLGAGAAYAYSHTSSASQVDDLKKQLASQAAQDASKLADVQTRLDSADASLTTVSQQYTLLQQKQSADKAKAGSTSSSSNTTSSTTTLAVISRTISPSEVATGDYITLTARVQGGPDKVAMRITSSSTGDSNTYSLKKSSTSGNIQRWKLTIRAPKKKGTYTYYATAYRGTKSATMPGASPSKFTVK